VIDYLNDGSQLSTIWALAKENNTADLDEAPLGGLNIATHFGYFLEADRLLVVLVVLVMKVDLVVRRLSC